MLLETLHRVCRSALDVLEPAVTGDLIACELTQIAKRDLGFPMVAAAHYPEGELRRLVVGCEPRLAEHLAGELPPAAGEQTDGARAGLAALCERIRLGLIAGGLTAAADQPFIVHDSSRFRVCSEGARNFHLRAAAAEGRIDLLLDLAEPETSAESIKFGSAAPGKSIADPTLIARIMAELQHNSADVQLKMPQPDGGEELWPGTILRPDQSAPADRVMLAYAGSEELAEASPPPQIKLMFVLHRRLLESVCEVVSLDVRPLDGDLALPVLVLRHPLAIAAGQRRGAQRVEPPRPVKGTLQRVTQSTDGVSLGGKSLPVRVLDVSATGVRLAFQGGVMVSGFRWGTSVTCSLNFPEPIGEVALAGEVRRVDLLGDGQGLGGASIGVEFTMETAESAVACESVGHYIASCQEDAENLTGGIVLSSGES